MRFSITLLRSVVALLLALPHPLQAADVLMWSSIGAGTRAFPFLKGVANICRQAGLLGAEPGSSKFQSMAGGSSAGWFFAQLFFSPQYYERTVLSTADELNDFMIEWLTAYGEIWNIFVDIWRRGRDSGLADLIKGDTLGTPFFWENMLEIASNSIGDPEWPKRPTTPENRVLPLQTTEMMIASAMHPNHRVKNGLFLFDSITYLGPSNSDNVYSTPFALQYAVKNDRTMFFKGVRQEELPIKTCVARSRKLFRMNDYDTFPLYPRNRDGNGSLLLPKSQIRCDREGLANAPFGGKAATALQAALISSATFSEFTSKAPSSYAQALTTEFYRNDIEKQDEPLRRRKTELLIQKRAQLLWKLNDKIFNLSLCFQYPKRCGVHDPQFSHASVLDGATLPMQIAQYQEVDGHGTTDRLKIIMTIPGISPANFLAYFGQAYNLGVAPGEYLWRPNGFYYTSAPWCSLQIFEQFLSEQDFDEKRVPVEGTFVSTVILENLTTVDNPTLHVRQGQTVDILVIIADPDFPLPQDTGAIPGSAKKQAEAFGEIAKLIGFSPELLGRVQMFTS